MANFVFNVAKGRVAELAHRVNNNDPTNAALIVVAITTQASDATLVDLDTLAAVLADADTSEVTNVGYARKVLDQDAGVTVTVDDSGDKVLVDLPDLTWTGVEAGDAWTDLLIAYDPDTTIGDDSSVIPLTLHDFEVTPDGSDIIAQMPAGGPYQAA